MELARIAYNSDQIRQRVEELAGEISDDVKGERPLMVAVLRGSVIFLSDLVRRMEIDPDVDFISISSYQARDGGAGVVRILKDLDEPLQDRVVILVEDIVDTGLTLAFLHRTLADRDPGELKVCTLVNKPVRRIADTPIDYVGFESHDFLIGYGLDFKGRYRNLPHLMSVSDLPALAAQPEALTDLFGEAEAPC